MFSMMMLAWAVMEVEKSARFNFQDRGKGFGDGLDMYVYGKMLWEKKKGQVTQNFLNI